MAAAPVHHTVVDKTSSWDGPAEEKAFDKKSSDLAKFYAWIDEGESDSEADGTDKEDGWGPHHEVNVHGVPGTANLKGIESAMAALNGAHGGSSRIPGTDRRGVWAHLAAHYEDAGIAHDDIPELKGHAVADRRIRAEYARTPEQRICPRREFELREVPDGTGGTNLRFTGFASVTGTSYEMEDWLGPWDETIAPGAFRKTLGDGADVVFLLNHTGMTLARTKPGTLKLSEVIDGGNSPVPGVTGLHSEALLDPQNLYVQAMRSAVDRGDLDEMSFAFRVLRQEWNKEYTERWINEVSLDKGDVSLVNYGANPHTSGSVSLRRRTGPLGTRGDRPLPTSFVLLPDYTTLARARLAAAKAEG